MNVADLIATLGFKVDNASKNVMNSTIQSMANSLSALESTASKVNTLLNIGIATQIAKPIVNLVKETTGLYGEFQQLKGGISTLFGTNEMSLEEYAESEKKSIADVKAEYEDLEKTEQLVMDNAKNAYKTAQMSQSEYMQTVTNFAAALKQSTGSAEEAAKAADTAIVAMADNWNKMGSNPEMVKNAYMGLARGNYMMIDNLKLGYAGTKKEMERMVEDASKISGKDLQMGELADMFEAIKIIQDTLNITGTSAKEAMFTLQGSSAMFKAAMTNLKTAIGSGEGFEDALEAVFESGEAVIDNYTPVIERSITGVVKIVSEVIPKAIDRFLLPDETDGKNLVQEIVPVLLKSVFETATTLIRSFPSVAKSVWDGLMDALSDAGESALGEDSALRTFFKEFGMDLDVALNKIKPLVEGLGGIEGTIETIGFAFSGFALIGVLGKIAPLISKIGAVINPVTAAVVLLGLAFQDLYYFFSGTGDSFASDFFAELGMNAQDVTDEIQQTLNDLLEWADEHVYPLVEDFFELVDELLGDVDVVSVVKGIGTVFKWLMGIIKPGIEIVIGLVRSVVNIIKGVVKGIKDVFANSEEANLVFEILGAVLDDIFERAKEIFEDLGKALEDLQPLIELISRALGVVLGVIITILGVVVDGILVAVDIFLEMLEWVSDKLTDISDIFYQLAGLFERVILNGENLFEAAREMQSEVDKRKADRASEKSEKQNVGKLESFDKLYSLIDNFYNGVEEDMDTLAKAQTATPEATAKNQTSSLTSRINRITQNNTINNNYTGVQGEEAKVVTRAMADSTDAMINATKRELAMTFN
jgi:phage-related protein